MNGEKSSSTEPFSKLRWLGEVHRGPKITPAEYRILLEIFNRTQGNGRGGNVALDTLADRSQLTLKTTKSSVRRLQELRYVVLTKQGGNLRGSSNVYALGKPTLGADRRPRPEWLDPDGGAFPKLPWLQQIHRGPPLSSSQVCVLVEIMLCTGIDGDGAAVSYRDLIALTKLSKNTVETAISHLRTTAWIERSGTLRDLSNVYRLGDPVGVVGG